MTRDGDYTLTSDEVATMAGLVSAFIESAHVMKDPDVAAVVIKCHAITKQARLTGMVRVRIRK